MIAFIEGKIERCTPTQAILACNGIGYEINISLNTFSAIQGKESCRLHTYLHIKEDSHTLYGFWEEMEKEVFTQLISVSGIGPGTGRMIISSLTPGEIRDAIISENVSLIQSIKGIGPKSAKRLILELKDKMGAIEGSTQTSSKGMNGREEALSALVMLGFSKSAADKAINQVLSDSEPGIEVEDIIKSALKRL